MKNFIFALPAALLILSCSTNSIRNEVGPTEKLNQYRNIHTGWINLNPGDWKKYGFENQGLWTSQIKDNNTLGFQKYLQSNLADRKITGAAAPNDTAKKGNLYIGFNVVEYKVTYGVSFSGMDELYLDVNMIDVAKNKSVYKATIMVEGFAPFPRNWKGATFDGRVDNMMYNLANLLTKKLR